MKHLKQLNYRILIVLNLIRNGRHIKVTWFEGGRHIKVIWFDTGDVLRLYCCFYLFWFRSCFGLQTFWWLDKYFSNSVQSGNIHLVPIAQMYMYNRYNRYMYSCATCTVLCALALSYHCPHILSHSLDTHKTTCTSTSVSGWYFQCTSKLVSNPKQTSARSVSQLSIGSPWYYYCVKDNWKHWKHK